MKKLLLTLMLCFWATSAFATALNSDEVKLLCHFDGTNGATTYTSDDANARTATFYNGAQISSEQSVFGGTSLKLYHATSTSYITFLDSPDWDTPNGQDFTIGFRIYFLSLPTIDDAVVALFQSGAEGGWNMYFAYSSYATSVKFGYVFTGISYWETAIAVDINTWYSFELCRSGTTYYVFMDGALIASKTTTATIPEITSPLYMRCKTNVQGVYYDELYIIKGRALHTESYTPETEAYTISGATQPYTSAFNAGFNEGFDGGFN